ncbi:MAG: cation diffusion facilitator family transporter [Treponema sp.]|nr:cation diffusion facilitator family transporter [Treponema sp.]
MISFLVKLFIHNPDDTENPAVREKYGVICGISGIFINILLFAFKLFAGIIAKSVAVTADAFNNLSDAGSSIITILGFKLSFKQPDAGHPFGHGRLEYISGLIVSFLIILAGVELLKSSIAAVIHPVPVETGLLPVIVLVISILAKFYMYLYNHRISKKIKSAAMDAIARDSLSDTISTFVVLASITAAHFIKMSLPLDGIAGIIVAVFIVISGLSAAKETINPLLGVPPTQEFVKEIEEETMNHEPIHGIHDLVVHDYGPGRVMISLHAEVPGDINIFELHEVIDNAERDIAKRFNCAVTIHMDPIDLKNDEVERMWKFVSAEVSSINPGITVHDLRLVPGPTHTNVIFDIVKPHSCLMSDEELCNTLSSRIKNVRPECSCIISVDHPFV